MVGAGPAGACVTWSLAKAGLNVICIEQGEWVDANQLPSTKSNWELERFGKFSPNPNVRAGKAFGVIDDRNSPISIANFNAVGGSSILFSGHFPRFHPSDFCSKSLDDVGDDWPINYQDLEPFFSTNDKIMGVAGLEGDPAYPKIDGLLPPVPLGRMGEVLANGFNNLGWHWWPSYSAISTIQRSQQNKCINLGPCNTGCSQGAKSSVDLTYWPEAIRSGAKLMTSTKALRIETDVTGSEATAVIARGQDGNLICFRAKRIVLACNGVGTPTLMLTSASKSHPKGVGNSSGLVGKNLMLHPTGYVEGIFDEDLNSSIGPQGCCLYSHEFYENDDKRGFKKGVTLQALRGPGPIESAISGVAMGLVSTGKEHTKSFLSRYQHTAHLAIIVEDFADQENMVTLKDCKLDVSGDPIPKIEYRLSENSKAALAFGINRSKEVMLAAGANLVSGIGPVRNTGWHLMGTTKMGNDSKSSVVDRFGKCHDVSNLYVADSSVFVTSGAVNPTSTLQAIALWVADNMLKSEYH